MSIARKEELFCANVLKSTFLSDTTLIAGDSEECHLPDLQTPTCEYGIEVTQLEKEKDFLPISHLREDDELFHAKDWVKQEYYSGLEKKHKKLNSGNYAGISGNVDLCICAIRRATTVFYPHLILYLYKKICEKQGGQEFQKIFYISSQSVFVIYPQNVTKITALEANGIIYDFRIEGDNYIQEKKYEINDFL